MFSSFLDTHPSTSASTFDKIIIDLPIARITSVDEKNSFFSAEIIYSSQKQYGFPKVVPFAGPGYSTKNRSGMFYVPQKDDMVLLASLGQGDYFPLVYLPIPIEVKDMGGENSGDANPKATTRYYKKDTFQGKDGDTGRAKPPNFSGGRRKMKSGQQGLMGADGLCGVVVNNRRFCKVFSSEECFTEHGGDHLDGGDPPTIRDFTINYLFDGDGCR